VPHVNAMMHICTFRSHRRSLARRGCQTHYWLLPCPVSLLTCAVFSCSSLLLLHREKELLRALAAQERQATRLRQRDVNTGPKDDLDIEWEQLMEAHHQAG